jgi:hypothetical protein
MFSSLRLVTFAREAPEDARAAVMRALHDAAHATDAVATLFEPTSPGSWNGGDVIWRAVYRDEAHCKEAESSAPFRQAASLLADRARVSLVEHVVFGVGAHGGSSVRGGVYRVALFCANRNPTADRLSRFRDDTLAMPHHVRTIRRWQLSPARAASGSRVWTHVWEQEYEELAGLAATYMLHPFHWAYVDRWFDPEDPDWLIDPVLCHAFCATDAPAIVE